MEIEQTFFYLTFSFSKRHNVFFPSEKCWYEEKKRKYCVLYKVDKLFKVEALH